jgi:predicted secreted protein
MANTLALSMLSVALVAGACASSDDEELVFESDDAKEDTVRPYGAFHIVDKTQDGFTTLKLNPNRTYEATQDWDGCLEHPCSVHASSYRFARSHGRTYVVLYTSEEGEEPASMEYRLSGTQLSLRDVGYTEWVEMTPNSEGLTFEERDNGGILELDEGGEVVVRLPANFTTGYRWQVTESDTTFGQPFEGFIPDSSAVGSGGLSTFTWTTTRVVPIAGTHHVTLAYRRPWDESVPPVQTYEFTVNVL